MKRLLLCAPLLAAAAGCVSSQVNISAPGTASITSVPAGARVFVNGAEICTATPCVWSEGDGLAHRYHLQLRMEGYREVDLYVDKELTFFGGLFTVASHRVPRQMAFTLEPAGPGGTSPAPAAPPPPAGTPPGGAASPPPPPPL